MSSCFLCVLGDDDEVGLDVCMFFCFLRKVLFCGGLSVGLCICIVCCGCEEVVVFV